MFSGIVETVQPILKATSSEGAVRIWVQRPEDFQDLKRGDSVAVDGICLTVEDFSQNELQFALAAETLRVLGWPGAEALQGRRVNLERSLRYGDRIHGHLVSGHVQSLAKLVESRRVGESLFLSFELPADVVPFIWDKGSITLQGVSLTVNELSGSRVQVCLIPETQKRTNLGDFKVGESINVEPDWMAKALTRAFETQLQNRLAGLGRVAEATSPVAVNSASTTKEIQ